MSIHRVLFSIGRVRRVRACGLVVAERVSAHRQMDGFSKRRSVTHRDPDAFFGRHLSGWNRVDGSRRRAARRTTRERGGRNDRQRHIDRSVRRSHGVAHRGGTVIPASRISHRNGPRFVRGVHARRAQRNGPAAFSPTSRPERGHAGISRRVSPETHRTPQRLRPATAARRHTEDFQFSIELVNYNIPPIMIDRCRDA